MMNTLSVSLMTITVMIKLSIRVSNSVTIISSSADLVCTMTSLSFWKRQIIALQQLKKAEVYIFNYHDLIHICEISALTSNNMMNEVKQAVYNKLSEKNVKKYKKARHTLIWKQWYAFLKLAWLKNKMSDMKDVKNLYQKTTMINEYIIKLIQNILQQWESHRLLKDINSHFHNWYKKMRIHMNSFKHLLLLYSEIAH